MKRNQPGLRILLSLHVSWSHFMYLFAGLLSHRERPRCWYLIIKPAGMGNQALALAPGSARRAVSICLPSWTQSRQSRLNAHCHKQGQEKNVWLFMNYLHFPWRKRQQQDKVFVWVGSCSEGHAWPMHSQRTQPALSIVQPQNYHTYVCSAHVIWTNMSSGGSFWLRDDITDSVSTLGLDHC